MSCAIAVRVWLPDQEWQRQIVVLSCIFLVSLLVFAEMLRAPTTENIVVLHGGVQLAGVCFTIVALLGMHDEYAAQLSIGIGTTFATCFPPPHTHSFLYPLGVPTF